VEAEAPSPATHTSSAQPFRLHRDRWQMNPRGKGGRPGPSGMDPDLGGQEGDILRSF